MNKNPQNTIKELSHIYRRRIEIVNRNAIKHGLSAHDVAYAWHTAQCLIPKHTPNEPTTYIAIGFTPRRREVELMGVRITRTTWLIYYAKTPATKKFKEEITSVEKGK